MDCFLSAVRESVFRKMPGNSAPEPEDAFWGLFKRAFSTSSSSYYTEDDDQAKQAPCNLKRQRAVAFLMGCYVCGGIKSRAGGGEGHEEGPFALKEGHMQRKEGQYMQEEGMQWWQERTKKRRKLGSSEWVVGEGNGNFLSRAPAKFKRLLRRERREGDLFVDGKGRGGKALPMAKKTGKATQGAKDHKSKSFYRMKAKE